MPGGMRGGELEKKNVVWEYRPVWAGYAFRINSLHLHKYNNITSVMCLYVTDPGYDSKK